MFNKPDVGLGKIEIASLAEIVFTPTVPLTTFSIIISSMKIVKAVVVLAPPLARIEK